MLEAPSTQRALEICRAPCRRRQLSDLAWNTPSHCKPSGKRWPSHKGTHGRLPLPAICNPTPILHWQRMKSESSDFIAPMARTSRSRVFCRPAPSMRLARANPTYTALSYTWGLAYKDGSHLTQSITCDGRAIAVTAKLHRPLGRRRQAHSRESQDHGAHETDRQASSAGRISPPGKREQGFALWIDYLSIDQENLNERSQQVAKMASIVRLAHKVVVWLREPV